MEHKKSNDISQRQLIYISRQFSNMFGIPVRLYLNYELIYSFFPVELSVDPVSLCEDGWYYKNSVCKLRTTCTTTDASLQEFFHTS